jgi:hypothetical protein
VWFNRTGRFGLEVSYKGPEVARQRIPDEVLYHLSADSESGTTNFVKGLRYQYFEGSWWRHLPNFNHIAPVMDGVVDNFDIEVILNNKKVDCATAIETPRGSGIEFTNMVTLWLRGGSLSDVINDTGGDLYKSGSRRILSYP